MSKDKIEARVEAFAVMDGWTKGGSPTVWKKGGKLKWTHQLPNYLDPVEGHGHIQRVIDGFNYKELFQYTQHLRLIVHKDDLDDWDGDEIADVMAHKATCEQKIEACLKAKEATK